MFRDKKSESKSNNRIYFIINLIRLTINYIIKLAADYNDLLKELASPKLKSIGCYTLGETIGRVKKKRKNETMRTLD